MRHRKILIVSVGCFLSISAIFVMALPGLAKDEQKNGISIVVSAPVSVKAGADVVLEISATNISHHDLLFGHFNDPRTGENDFNIDVFNSEGVLAPRTPYGKMVRREPQSPGEQIIFSGSAVLRHLAAGETLKESSMINRMFDLSPGVYTIKVWRADSLITEATILPQNAGAHAPPATNQPLPKPELVRSNTIKLTVVP